MVYPWSFFRCGGTLTNPHLPLSPNTPFWGHVLQKSIVCHGTRSLTIRIAWPPAPRRTWCKGQVLAAACLAFGALSADSWLEFRVGDVLEQNQRNPTLL